MQVFFSNKHYNACVAKVVSRLRELREAAGISQRELARAVCQDSSNISYWERTGKIPRSDLLLPIAQTLGVTVEELLGKPKPKRTSAPSGKLAHVFEAASKLPRRQQQKIIEFVEPFIAQHANGK